jgi:hypothetical protein
MYTVHDANDAYPSTLAVIDHVSPVYYFRIVNVVVPYQVPEMEPHGPWSKVVHSVGNREPFGMVPMFVGEANKVCQVVLRVHVSAAPTLIMYVH